MSSTSEVRHVLLDQVAGWRTVVEDGVTRTGSGGFWSLQPLPGQAEPLMSLELESEWLACPVEVTPRPCGGLLVVDAASHRVLELDPRGPGIKYLPVGGPGSAPRRLSGPRSAAALPGGAIAVADTENHRIQVLAPPSWPLVQMWGATDVLGRPRSGCTSREFDHPWALVSDDCGVLYVLDRGNRRIQIITFGGDVMAAFGPGLESPDESPGVDLVDPVDLALLRGPSEVLAVADPARGRVALLSTDGHLRTTVEGVERPLSVEFGHGGNLYVGDDRGRVHVFAQPDPTADEWTRVGVGVTGLDGEVLDLAVNHDGMLLAVVRGQTRDPSLPPAQSLWRIDPGAAFTGPGTLVTHALDSRIEECVWHRVDLEADVPAGTSIQIDTYTADVLDPAVDPTADDFGNWTSCVRTSTSDPDCLVQSPPGRYLWLRLRLRSNGLDSPVIRKVRVHYPRVGYLRYLPAVYQEDDESRLFLEHFLAIFQTSFDDIGARITRMWQLFDPASTPEKHLRWLAAWLALVVDPEWSEEKLRRMIEDAVASYKVRGTAGGLRQALRDYADVEASILEHYRLRRWPALALDTALDGSVRLWSRDFYQRLQLDRYSEIGFFRLAERPEPALEPLDWGANRFSVLFAADPYRVEETSRTVAAVVEREKPAHTKAYLCPVFPRLRVGVQATVGLDARVGGVSHLVLNRLATLGYDSILACSSGEQAVCAQGATRRPRVGVTTRLQ